MFLAKHEETTRREPPETAQRARGILIGADEDDGGQIEREISDLIDIVQRAPDPLEGARLARAGGIDVGLLVLDHHPDRVLAVAQQLAHEVGMAVVVVSRDRDPERIVQAMRAGARDFAYLGLEGDLRRAVGALRISEVAAPAETGTVIAVFGAKGGSGATTVATNLAGALRRGAGGERPTVLVDLDVQMGDAMVFLDLAGGYGWTDLLGNLERLDDELLERSLLRHGSGVRVVAATRPPEEAEPLQPSQVARALERLRCHAGQVVIDGLRDFGDVSLAALDAADVILLVFTQDIPALKNASRCISLFRRLGYGGDKVKLVVNRYHKRDKLSLAQIEEALGAKVVGTVANDYPSVVKAINAGKLLVDTAPRAGVTRDIRDLAVVLDPAVPPPRRHLFGRGGGS